MVDGAKQPLCVKMVSVMKMEFDRGILKLQKVFISELIKILGYWVCYRRVLDLDNQPTFSNAEGAEELPQYFFKSVDSELFIYLYANITSILSEPITPRS